MRRFFVGVKIPDAMGEALLQLEAVLQSHVQAKRWYGVDQFHITTNFLGELTDSDLQNTIRLLDQTASDHESFHLSLSGVGAFPRARVVWCGVGGETDRLVRLYDRLREAFRPLAADRFAKPVFTPHISLARTGDLSSFRPETVDVEQLLMQCEWTVDQVCLFESLLHPDGARYPVIHSVNLKQRTG
ncbi:RNA 2',3'-cyclic phosphodiesterase [Effusibacillus dendaii]|uniref:RNA 2',3'-cyclic phosphodiesterase n=1 Tax=Effusibacillus dendaii TaxID=2743772 RepID=A0A7I8D8T7_9BACL|nr:RNA 2',3'-cyclic phosphodiesterase [Effusibacillus dendaii]BCJ86558.1 RNA 2',3'-cyclic phosphodiesterase [Effusibacillus dendaii]